MDSGEKQNIAQKQTVSFGDVARRVGGVLANLVPNSRPLYRERLEGRAEPSLSMPPEGQDAGAEDEVIHSLDAQRKKRGAEKRELDSPHESPTEKRARSLDALRKKKSA